MKIKKRIPPPTMKKAMIIAIRRALIFARGNRSDASRILEIPERTFYRKLKEYGINASDYRVEPILREKYLYNDLIPENIKEESRQALITACHAIIAETSSEEKIQRAKKESCVKCRKTLSDAEVMELCGDCPNRVNHKELKIG